MKIQKSRLRIVHLLSGFIICSAAQAADKPILLSINAHAGHGIGGALSLRVNQQADVHAFLFDQPGMQLPQK